MIVQVECTELGEELSSIWRGEMDCVPRVGEHWRNDLRDVDGQAFVVKGIVWSPTLALILLEKHVS